MFKYLWVCSDIRHSGWALTYSTISGMIPVLPFHSGCKSNTADGFTNNLFASAHAKSAFSEITTFNSSAWSMVSFNGGQCFFGETQIQSKLPLTGQVPEVSKKRLYPCAFNASHKGARSCIRGSPPVITTFTAGVPDICATMDSMSHSGNLELSQVLLESHQGQCTLQPPRRRK